MRSPCLLARTSCLLKDFMVIRCIYRREDVFRYSGNIGAGDHNSGDLIFAQNSQQRAGTKIGCTQADYCGFRKNAIGYCRLCFVAGGDGSFYTTLGKRPFPLSLSRSRPGCDYMDNLLGVNRISEEMNGHWKLVFGKWLSDN
jgi:hypothetical protein